MFTALCKEFAPQSKKRLDKEENIRRSGGQLTLTLCSLWKIPTENWHLLGLLLVHDSGENPLNNLQSHPDIKRRNENIRFVFVGCNQDNQEKQDWDRARSHQNQKGDSNHVLCSAPKHYSHLWRYILFNHPNCHLDFYSFFSFWK